METSRRYPRHQVLKRPWEPKPGAHYVSTTQAFSVDPRDWVLFYIRGENSDPYEISRHSSRKAAMAAFDDNVRILRDLFGLDTPKVFEDLPVAEKS